MISWIGQHIWDFVSRFRNDVYLENIADGTVDSDKFLGLDSNNKIVKEAVSSGTTYTAGTGLDLGGTEFSVDVSDFMSNGVDNRVVTATGADTMNAEANLTWNNIQLGLEYSGADGPTVLLTKTGDNATAPIINFVAQRAANGGTANNDDDYLGYTRYWGYNNAGTPEAIKFAEIHSQISERDDGVEEGKLDLLVQAQGALRTGFSCVGNGSAVVDTTIGTGATSVATIAGDLAVTSHLNLGGHDVDDIDLNSENSNANDHLMSSKAINLLVTGSIPDHTLSTGSHTLYQTKVTFDQAACNNLHTGTVASRTLVAAQGANTMIVPQNVVVFADRAVNNTVSLSLHVGYDGNTGTPVRYARRFMYNVSTDQTYVLADYLGNVAADLTTTINSALTATFDAGCTNNCFTSLTFYTSYYVIDIS